MTSWVSAWRERSRETFMGRTIVKVHSGKKVAEIAVDQMRLNGGLKVRDLGFKPPTGNRACPSLTKPLSRCTLRFD